MWETIASAIGVKAVEKLFDKFNQKDSGSISVGLAVGYYYNFLDPVSGVIERDELELYSSPTDPSPKKFKSQDVRVQIIVPSRLEVQAFQRCVDEFEATQKGFIFLRQNKRYYGVNYTLTELPNKTELTIVDLARPIMSAKRYYEDILNQNTHDDANEKWIKSQLAEIAAFKEAIRRLQKRGYGALVNKLDFRERA
jgi:hypothetical protein